MTNMNSLLIELGTEELPVKALPGLAQALFDGVIDGLAKRGIAFERGDAKPLYSPRRLAVLLPGVADQQPQQTSEVLGPYLNIALDANGEPTKALLGFAQKAGIDWRQLDRTTDNKGERFVHRAVKPGQQMHALLPEILREAIAAMPIPKPMRWGDHDHAFARPVHWLVLLHGDDVIDGEVFGIRSDRMSRGHRFMHDKVVWIGRAEDYVDALRGAKVLVDPDERRARIVREVEHAAQQTGGTARIADDNLEQVNCLVEWPKAVSCSFDSEFLAVPQEALVATMETNQKFFPVLGDDDGLSERFIGIANIDPKDDSEIRKGYERVIRPRFADAKFFFVEDMKQGLASMNEGLKSVTYHARLGSLDGKVQRVAALAEAIAAEVGVDPKLARRAAVLSKADLQSRLVNEFPELQGIAGRYYAAAEDESLEVANAIDEGYMPRFADDAIAPSKLGQVLAIAERLDTLAGGFATELMRLGSNASLYVVNDPFALRRNALGLGRTLLETQMDLPLRTYLQTALKQLDDQGIKFHPLSPSDRQGRTDEELLEGFVFERLRPSFENDGYSSQQFDAVGRGLRQRAPASVYDFALRMSALREFFSFYEAEAEALDAARKRIRNILRKVEGEVPSSVDAALFSEPAERDLHDAMEQAIMDTDKDLAMCAYVAVLRRLARLCPQVDAFFDGVMVNVDDAAVRNNRLALLKRLSDRLGSVAAIEEPS